MTTEKHSVWLTHRTYDKQGRPKKDYYWTFPDKESMLRFQATTPLYTEADRRLYAGRLEAFLRAKELRTPV